MSGVCGSVRDHPYSLRRRVRRSPLLAFPSSLFLPAYRASPTCVKDEGWSAGRRLIVWSRSLRKRGTLWRKGARLPALHVRRLMESFWLYSTQLQAVASWDGALVGVIHRRPSQCSEHLTDRSWCRPRRCPEPPGARLRASRAGAAPPAHRVERPDWRAGQFGGSRAGFQPAGRLAAAPHLAASCRDAPRLGRGEEEYSLVNQTCQSL